MGIRTPDLLIANETLYQLSYTPNIIDFSELHYISGARKMLVCTSNVIGRRHQAEHHPCLKRHEINGDYYAAKKIRGKIKTHALRPKSRIAITYRKLAERELREWLVWNGKTSFQPCERSSR